MACGPGLTHPDPIRHFEEDHPNEPKSVARNCGDSILCASPHGVRSPGGLGPIVGRARCDDSVVREAASTQLWMVDDNLWFGGSATPGRGMPAPFFADGAVGM
jgi:hypothetical protein